MKTVNICSLFQDNFKTIGVQFNDPFGDSKTYTYKVKKSLEITEGDTVVVNSPRGGLKLAKVACVDEEPNIDYHANYKYKWIVQKVDVTEYNEIVEAENNFEKTLRDIEAKRVKNEVIEHLKEKLGAKDGALLDDAVSKLTKV